LGANFTSNVGEFYAIFLWAVLYNAKENIAKVSRRINQPMKSKSFAEFMGSLLNIWKSIINKWAKYTFAKIHETLFRCK
jgi:hypothetical protein